VDTPLVGKVEHPDRPPSVDDMLWDWIWDDNACFMDGEWQPTQGLSDLRADYLLYCQRYKLQGWLKEEIAKRYGAENIIRDRE
jgi:hypothetical protein